MIKHKNITWCRDGFHPTNVGHEYIMTEANLALNKNIPIHLIYKNKYQEFLSLYNNPISLFTIFNISISIILLVIIGFPIICVTILMNIIYVK